RDRPRCPRFGITEEKPLKRNVVPGASRISRHIANAACSPRNTKLRRRVGCSAGGAQHGRRPMSPLIDDAAHWRGRAENIRTLAERTTDAEVRRGLLES